MLSRLIALGFLFASLSAHAGSYSPLIWGVDSFGVPAALSLTAEICFPDGTCIDGSSGSGSVTSVGLSLPASIFSVSGSPVSTTGTLTGTFLNQSANTVFSGPTTGSAAAPAFRLLVAADIPALSASKITSGQGSLTTSTTGVTVTGTNAGLAAMTVDVQTASGSQPGLLSAANWTTFNGKQAAGNYITALTSDVSAAGPGSAAATVNSVGGSAAADVHTAELAANAATAVNTASTILKRDISGQVAATTFTGALAGNASTATTATNATNIATTATNATNAAFYPAFVASSTSSNQGADTSTGLVYNPTLGLGVGTSTLTGPMNLKALGTSLNQGLNLTSSDGSYTLELNQRGSGEVFLYDGSNIHLDCIGVFCGHGNASPVFRWDVNGLDTGTSVTSPAASGATIAAHNKDSTVNNTSQVVFAGTNDDVDSAIVVTHEVHTHNAASGHMSFVVSNAGTRSERLKIAKDGVLTASAYGAGVAQFDSSGVVSSSTVATASIANPATVYLSMATGELSSPSFASETVITAGKTPRAIMVENLVAVASDFSVCTVNPTVTLYDCGTSAGTCLSGQTAVANVTVTAAGTSTDGTVTSATIAAGHYWAITLTAGACTSLNLSATAEAVMQ